MKKSKKRGCSLTKCQQDLSDARINETNLKARIKKLEDELKEKHDQNENRKEDDFYVVGSSIFREVRDSDIVNGSVKCIRGGTIKTIRSDFENHEFEE